MSLRFKPARDAIAFDASGCFHAGSGFDKAELAQLATALEADRAALAGRPDVSLPERLLHEYKEYKAGRATSLLGRALKIGTRLREEGDAVVVLGSRETLLGARAVFDACCHPFHNALGRAERGGRARVYLETEPLDNDRLQGLLDVLGANRFGESRSHDPLRRWSLLVVDPTGEDAGLLAAHELFSRIQSRDNPIGELDECVSSVVVAPEQSTLARTASESPGAAVFALPDPGEGFDAKSAPLERVTAFTAVELLCGVAAGIDVVRYLEGAAAVTRRFFECAAFSNRTRLGANPMLDWAGLERLAGRDGTPASAKIFLRDVALHGVAGWYDALRDGSHAAHLMIRWESKTSRRDRLLDARSGKAFPELQTEVGVQRAAAESHSVGVLTLPAIEEYVVGQMLQAILLIDALNDAQ